MTLPSGGAYYKEYPKSCDPDDFWGQVGRTINGKPVPQEQIDLIVASVSGNLSLSRDDCLLDLCCGNGALSAYFFAQCRGGLGVDFSDCLIEIANRRFRLRESESFRCMDVLEYVDSERAPKPFTKALCYGAFQYLPPPAALEMLDRLRYRFTGVERFLIGNLPDKDRLDHFYADKPYVPGIENKADSPIGLWRSTGEFQEFAARTGWRCSISRMQAPFYGSAYRYDALLIPA